MGMHMVWYTYTHHTNCSAHIINLNEVVLSFISRSSALDDKFASFSASNNVS